jgi:Asp-tRNA(Asn)/Glu-tRNA(Gln) amidotransferase A subunit family amidase
MSESAQTIAEAVEAIADGRLTARQWTEHCLHQIESHNAIGAWSFVDRERALGRADAMDWLRKDGSAFGSCMAVQSVLKTLLKSRVCRTGVARH